MRLCRYKGWVVVRQVVWQKPNLLEVPSLVPSALDAERFVAFLSTYETKLISCTDDDK